MSPGDGIRKLPNSITLPSPLARLALVFLPIPPAAMMGTLQRTG